MQQEEEEEEEEVSRAIIGRIPMRELTHIPRTENMELQKGTAQEWVGPQEVQERGKEEGISHPGWATGK